MNAQMMWDTYSKGSGITADYQAWSYGVDADHLANLTLTGIKTATASAYPLYEIDGEVLPEAGEYSVVLDAQGNAVCVVKTTCVYVVPFDLVSADHAWKEGEGDRSLSYWRNVHKEVFTKWLQEEGLDFYEKMPVVCEEFVRVFP